MRRLQPFVLVCSTEKSSSSNIVPVVKGCKPVLLGMLPLPIHRRLEFFKKKGIKKFEKGEPDGKNSENGCLPPVDRREAWGRVPPAH
jgi:hypothetical protein